MAEPPKLDLPLLTGPLLILVSIAFMLFGVFCAQVFYYSNAYKSDSARLRYYVYSLGLLETLHTAFCLHMLYTYFVLDVYDVPSIGHIIWSTGHTVFCEVLIVTMTEGFYIYRVYHLSSRNPYAAATPVVFLVCRVVFGFATGVLTYHFDTWEGFRDSHAAVITVNCGLALGALVDMLCAGLLTYYLRMHDSKFRRTKHLVHTLMFYTINTGALTTVASLAILFTFNFVGKSLMFAGMVQVASKLYANSMLALLNARNKIKKTGKENTFNFQSIPLSLRANLSPNDTQTMGVQVDIIKGSDATEGSMTEEADTKALSIHARGVSV